MKKIFLFIMTVLVFSWFGYLIYENKVQFKPVFELDPKFVVAACSISLIYILSQGLILKYVVEPFKINLEFKEWFGILVVTLFGNYIFPFAGIGFRATYLKRQHNLSWGDFLATTAVIYWWEFLVFAIGGALGLLLLSTKLELLNWMLLGILVFGIIVLVSIYYIPLFVPKLPLGRFSEKINNILKAWHRIKADKTMMIKVGAATILQFFVYSLLFSIAFLAFGFNIPLEGTFLAACLSDYSFFLRLAPASLGTYEASIMYTTGIYGLSMSQGLMVATFARVSMMICYFVLGPIFSLMLAGGITKAALNQN